MEETGDQRDFEFPKIAVESASPSPVGNYNDSAVFSYPGIPNPASDVPDHYSGTHSGNRKRAAETAVTAAGRVVVVSNAADWQGDASPSRQALFLCPSIHTLTADCTFLTAFRQF